MFQSLLPISICPSLINKHTPVLLHTNSSCRSPLCTVIACPPAHLNLNVMLPLPIVINKLELLLILHSTNARQRREQASSSALLPRSPRVLQI